MKPQKLAFAAAALLAGLALSQQPSVEKFTIPRVYKPGSYLITQQVDMDQEISRGDAPATTQRVSMTMVAGLVVEKPDASGDRKMVMKFRRFKQQMAMGPGMTIAYDSDDPPEKRPMELDSVFGALLKARISMTMGADGQVKKVEGLSELWDAMAKGNPAMAQMAEMMKKQMGDAWATEMTSLFPGPDKPVGIGEQWTVQRKLAVPMLGPATLEMKSTLKEVQKGPGGQTAVINFVGSLRTTEPTTATAGPVQMTVQGIELDQVGTSRINLQDMVPMTVVVDQKAAFTMSVGPPGEAAQSIKMKQKGFITMKLELDTSPSTAPAPAAGAPERL
jgi:hypothetical protein